MPISWLQMWTLSRLRFRLFYLQLVSVIGHCSNNRVRQCKCNLLQIYTHSANGNPLCFFFSWHVLRKHWPEVPEIPRSFTTRDVSENTLKSVVKFSCAPPYVTFVCSLWRLIFYCRFMFCNFALICRKHVWDGCHMEQVLEHIL